MRLKKTYYLFFGLFIILNQSSCDLSGHKGISNNIDESKKRNLFICEYMISSNPYILNDTLKIKVLNAWVEKQWGYGKNNNETLIIDGKYQLIIQVDSNILENYGLTWLIGVDGHRYLRSCGRNCLVSDFNHKPQAVEAWEVQKGAELDSFSKKEIIGIFTIKKVSN